MPTYYVKYNDLASITFVKQEFEVCIGNKYCRANVSA